MNTYMRRKGSRVTEHVWTDVFTEYNGVAEKDAYGFNFTHENQTPAWQIQARVAKEMGD